MVFLSIWLYQFVFYLWIIGVFIRWIQWKFILWLRKKFCNSLQHLRGYYGHDFSNGNKLVNISFEDGALIERTEGLVNISVDATWCDSSIYVCCSAFQGFDQKVSEHTMSIYFKRNLIRSAGGQDSDSIIDQCCCSSDKVGRTNGTRVTAVKNDNLVFAFTFVCDLEHCVD